MLIPIVPLRPAAARVWTPCCLSLAMAALGLLVTAHAAVGAVPPAPADLARGKALFTKICVTCHGNRAQGKRDVDSPALHTQEPWYLLARLQKFRTGLRGTDPNDVTGSKMSPIAKALPDEQSLTDLAAYISALEGPPAISEVKGDAAAGAATYKKICVPCHGVDARGKPEVKSPALVGQNDWYIVNQLTKFRHGLRGFDPKDVQGAQMRAVVSTLATDQAVKDVASYLASLK